jgi:hypothetical protein
LHQASARHIRATPDGLSRRRQTVSSASTVLKVQFTIAVRTAGCTPSAKPW